MSIWSVITTSAQLAWNWYTANIPNLTPIGAVIGGGVLAWAALRQAATASRRHYAQTDADQQRRITESFSKAVEHLGSDRIEMRLGGIYTLERIARESLIEHWPVMETLTAFVRERSPEKNPPVSVEDTDPEHLPLFTTDENLYKAVVITVLLVKFRNPIPISLPRLVWSNGVRDEDKTGSVQMA